MRYGEDIRVSGNVPSLGCDDVSRAVQLVTSPTDFPWWTTTTGIVAFFVVLYYFYAM